MAVDEAVLEAVAAGAAGPTLRIYGWRGRWLSIGMAESIADVDRDAAAAAAGRIVRRPSGGAAVLHRRPAGLVADAAERPLARLARHRRVVPAPGRDRARLLRPHRRGRARGHAEPRPARRCPIRSLALACFGGLAPHEIVVGDPPRKLIGWGQVRRRGVVMHHAVLSRRFDAAGLAGLLRAEPGAAGRRARPAGSPTCARRPAATRRCAELLAALAAAHAAAGLSLRPGQLAEAERRRADRLVAEKYRLDGWTSRR